ncbi:ABC transporter permease [Oceaniovalibus sp. ACAM 378]|uniref:ABC transporter permease n=1 Tax=Oceaniovalibus sp. ACAM 378 TaxID=2599923 RepID=UPI002106E624|nr:ABC transporter permease [Oceaniovalibus sp. ACAM 378]
MKTRLANLRQVPPTALFGIVIVILYIVLAILTPALTPYSQREIVGGAFLPWTSAHPLGTDSLGRDMLTRLLYGGRNTLGIAFVTTILAFAIGMAAGLVAVTVGGWLEPILSRIVDMLMSIPQLIFKLFLLSIFGTSIPTLILVIAVLDSTRVFRLTRAAASSIAVMDYVEAARLRGEGPWWLMTREILPNITAPLIAEFGLRFCFVFLAIAALSFLGLGIQPPLADWGSMVRENATLITFGDITPLIPAAAIAVLTISVNFIVDWMLHKSTGLKE